MIVRDSPIHRQIGRSFCWRFALAATSLVVAKARRKPGDNCQSLKRKRDKPALAISPLFCNGTRVSSPTYKGKQRRLDVEGVFHKPRKMESVVRFVGNTVTRKNDRGGSA